MTNQFFWAILGPAAVFCFWTYLRLACIFLRRYAYCLFIVSGNLRRCLSCWYCDQQKRLPYDVNPPFSLVHLGKRFYHINRIVAAHVHQKLPYPAKHRLDSRLHAFCVKNRQFLTTKNVSMTYVQEFRIDLTTCEGYNEQVAQPVREMQVEKAEFNMMASPI